MVSLMRFRVSAVAFFLALGSVCAPIALGGTPPVARFALESLVAASACLWAIANRQCPRMLAVPLISLVLAAAQCTPLPSRLILPFAPSPALAWKTAGEDAPLRWPTISVDPHATLLASHRLLLALATIVMVADLARSAGNRQILSGGLAASAIFALGLGFVFPPQRNNARVILGGVDFAGPIEFWLTPVVRPLETAAFGYRRDVAVGVDSYPVIDWGVGDGFGSYLISNHFAGAIALTLPAAMGWLLFLGGKRLSAAACGAAAMAVLGAAAWVVGGLAGSRAGVCAVVAAGVSCLALAAQQKASRWVFSIAAAACAAGVFGGMVLLYGRWSGIVELVPAAFRQSVVSMLSDGRATATAIAFRVFRGSPFFGTGLSTFGEINSNKEWGGVPLYFAHNDYAQWTAETGLFGVMLAGVAAWFVLKQAAAFMRLPWHPDRALDAGAWGGLAGIAAHSAFDWNLHVPANAFLACVVVGLAIASGSPPVAAAAAAAPPLRPRPLWQQGLPWALCGACLVAIVFLGRDYQAARSEAQLRQALTKARIATADPAKDSAAPDLLAAVESGDRMAKWDPGNAQLAALLGQANLVLSIEPQPIEQANQRRQTAKAWFRKAKRNSAVCFGIPPGLPFPAQPGAEK